MVLQSTLLQQLDLGRAETFIDIVSPVSDDIILYEMSVCFHYEML